MIDNIELHVHKSKNYVEKAQKKLVEAKKE